MLFGHIYNNKIKWLIMNMFKVHGSRFKVPGLMAEGSDNLIWNI
jgi:hypothetical protein